VELGIVDQAPEDVYAAIELEKPVYSNLKYYIRIMRSFNPNKDVVISQKAKLSAPSALADKADNSRRTNFSFSLANMIQMASSRESQLLLQTLDVEKRMKAQKTILIQAAEILGEQAKSGVLSETIKDEIKRSSFEDDYDQDILPKEESKEEEKNTKDEWDINNIE